MQANESLLTQPGIPAFPTVGASHVFGNAAIALSWTVSQDRLAGFALTDRAHARTLQVTAPFALRLADGQTLSVADLKLLAPIREETLSTRADAGRLAERIAGHGVVALLGDEQ